MISAFQEGTEKEKLHKVGKEHCVFSYAESDILLH